MELIANNLKDIGADVPSSPDTGTNVFDSFNTGGIFATGQYDVALFANNWAPDPDSFASYVAANQIPSPTNQSGGNWGHANDPALDALFQQGANTLDITKRIGLYNQAQAEWLDYAPTVQLYERPDVFSLQRQLRQLRRQRQQRAGDLEHGGLVQHQGQELTVSSRT